MKITDIFFKELEFPTGTIEFMDVQWTDEQGNIGTSTDAITIFNNFNQPTDFEKHLVELYSLMCNEVNEKLKESSDAKFTKLLYLEAFQDKNKQLLKIIIAEHHESGIESFYHKNLEVKNISDIYEDQHQSNFHSFFKDYLFICTDFINRFQDYINKRCEHVIRLEEKDFSQPIKPIKKLKTNLSVGELSTLFRILRDKNLIIPENKNEIPIFITQYFESKERENIKLDSANNKFYSPPLPSLSFWEENLLLLRQKIQDLKSK